MWRSSCSLMVLHRHSAPTSDANSAWRCGRRRGPRTGLNGQHTRSANSRHQLHKEFTAFTSTCEPASERARTCAGPGDGVRATFLPWRGQIDRKTQAGVDSTSRSMRPGSLNAVCEGVEAVWPARSVKRRKGVQWTVEETPRRSSSTNTADTQEARNLQGCNCRSCRRPSQSGPRPSAHFLHLALRRAANEKPPPPPSRRLLVLRCYLLSHKHAQCTAAYRRHTINDTQVMAEKRAESFQDSLPFHRRAQEKDQSALMGCFSVNAKTILEFIHYMLCFSWIFWFPLSHSVLENNILACLMFIKTIPTSFYVLKETLNLEVRPRLEDADFCDPDFFSERFTRHYSYQLTSNRCS